MNLLENVAKTYKRNDIEGEGRRLGFIAQDIQAVAGADMGNLTASHDGVMGLDYGRLSAVLWTCCREFKQEIDNLKTEVALLKTPKTKSRAIKKTT